MPSVTRRQRNFFLAELIKKQKGKKTKTGLSEKVIKEFLKVKPKHR